MSSLIPALILAGILAGCAGHHRPVVAPSVPTQQHADADEQNGTSHGRDSAHPQSTLLDWTHFDADIEFALSPDKMHPLGINSADIAKAIDRFYEAQKDAHFSLEDLMNIEVA